MKKIFQIILFTYFPFFVPAQPLGIQWQKNYGGSLLDVASGIIKISDGYVISAYSESIDNDLTSNFGGLDAWLFKLDNYGVLQWQKNYGGSQDDYFSSIKQTVDGGYILGGNSSSNDLDVSGNNGGRDFWIVKTDSLGIIEWQKCFGGSSREDLNSIQLTSDGGYIASGLTCSNDDGDVLGYHPGAAFAKDIWIIKLDSSGTLLWQKCFGGSSEDTGYEIKQTTDSGYIVTGVTASLDGDITMNHGGNDYWVVKMNSVGIIQWQKCYGGTNFELANYIQPTYDGGYLISGQANSSNGDLTSNYGGKDCWLIKIDSVGAIQWQKNYGGTGNEIAFSVIQNSDSTYVVLSNTNSNNIDVFGNHGGKDIWLFELNSAGTLIWQKCYGGSLDDEAFLALESTPDGGYAFAGYSASNDMDVFGNYGNWDSWVVKLNVPVGLVEINNQQLINVYPNPSSGQFSFSNLATGNTIEIYDLLGKIVFQTTVFNEQKFINISETAKGFYFYRIINKNKLIQLGKICVE